MRERFYFLMIGLLLAACVLPAAAQRDEDMRHHVIIAVDMAGCNNWNGTPEVARAVGQMLRYSGYGHCPAGRPLFDDGDYLSMLGFRTDPRQKNMSTFHLPLSSGDDKFVYHSGSRKAVGELVVDRWASLVASRQSDSGDNYSLVSVAKTYALNSVCADSGLVNRTFLIMVTDHHYNGNDFYDEMTWLGQTSKNAALSHDSVFALSYAVESEYFIKYLKTTDLGRRGNVHLYVELYEYVPLQRFLALNSVLDFPPTVTARRRPGGKYEVDVPVAERGDAHYRLERLDVFPAVGERYASPEGCATLRRVGSGQTVRVLIDRSARADSLAMRAWLNLRDSVYNATVLSPSAAATVYMGREGLNARVPIVYEPDARILGLLPMPDWLWWLPMLDQHWMAGLWSILIVALLLWRLLAWIRRSRYYEAGIGDIEMNFKR